MYVGRRFSLEEMHFQGKGKKAPRRRFDFKVGLRYQFAAKSKVARLRIMRVTLTLRVCVCDVCACGACVCHLARLAVD